MSSGIGLKPVSVTLPTDQPTRHRTGGFLLGLAGNAAWHLTAVVATQGSMLLAMMIAARMLSQDELGRLGFVHVTTISFGAALGSPIGLAVTKLLAELLELASVRAGGVLTLGRRCGAALSMVGFGVGWLCATRIAPTNGGATETWLLTIGAGAFLSLTVLAHVQRGILAGFQAFRSSAVLAAINAPLTSILLVGGAWYGGCAGGCVGGACGTAILVSMQYFTIQRLKQDWRLTDEIQQSWAEFRPFVRFAFPTLLAQNLMTFTNWFCLVLLLRLPHGLSEAGIFTIANQWFLVLQLLPASINAALLPQMCRALAQQGTARVRHMMLAAMASNGVLVLPLALVVVAMAGEILSIYGPEYRSQPWPLIFSVMTSALQAVQAPIGSVLASRGKGWTNLGVNLLWCVTFIVLASRLVESGANGLALARLIAYGLHFLWVLGLAWRYLEMPAANNTAELAAREE